jgi:peptidoglycan/xylan/chitin deacetylase (PgdA/CDA1 family)
MKYPSGRSRAWVRAAAPHLTGPIGSVRSVRTELPHIVLTYDDGPDIPGTTAVLSNLAKHDATATFFVLVPKARRHRGLLNEIMAAGHEIALHGVDHRRLTTFSAREVLRRTRAGRAELEDLIGAPVRWFRPPYGAQLPATWVAIRSAGLTPVVWGPTPRDWEDLTETELATQSLVGSGQGAIVLAHDGYAGLDDGADDGPEPRFDRGLLTSLMLDQYRERGLVGRSLGDALVHGKAVKWAWFRR